MFRSIIFTFGIRICSAVLNFLIIVLLSKTLGPEGKGVCTRYLAIISNALIFCDLVGGPAIVFLAARYRVRDMVLPSYLWSTLTSCLTIGTFLALHKIESGEAMHLILLSFLNSAISIHQNILSGRLEFTKINVMIFLQALFTFVFLKFLFSKGGNYPSDYVYALYAAWLPVALLGFFFVLSQKEEKDRLSFFSFVKQAFRFGFSNQLGHILQFFNQRLSYFLLGEAKLGVFSNATSIGESVWMVSNSIATVQYGKVSNTPDKAKAEKISLVLLKLNLVICFFGALFIALLPDTFFVWVFGKEFSGIHHTLLLLAPGIVCFSGYLIIGHHFSGRGQFARNLIPIVSGLLFTLTGLTLVMLLYPSFTVSHAAALTSLAYGANFVSALILFLKDSGVSFSDLLPSASDIRFVREEMKRDKNDSVKKD